MRSFTDRIDLWVFGRFHHFETDDPIQNEDGTLSTHTEEYWDAGVNLGYEWRDQIRIGIQALYRERGGGNVSDLGIDGLEVGMTVQYTPD